MHGSSSLVFCFSHVKVDPGPMREGPNVRKMKVSVVFFSPCRRCGRADGHLILNSLLEHEGVGPEGAGDMSGVGR